MFLASIFGYRLYLVLGDTLVLDRYRWLLKRLPETRETLTLIDIGCGTGAFTLASAARGYDSIGLSWDKRNQKEAQRSARKTNLSSKARFEIADVRDLHLYDQYKEYFDVCINFENIEHIIDDRKVIHDIYRVLKPGGMLLLSTPYYFYNPITSADKGPLSKDEDGGHVRRGYTQSMLRELCKISGFQIEEISSCSGFFSQKITSIYRLFFGISPFLAWIIILPFRFLPLFFDKLIKQIFGTIDYSICMVAIKPRYQKKS
tara:strand:+ start:762 stop:1541 length:780 start_codon:yes stop_codon:yes gene_type:complete